MLQWLQELHLLALINTVTAGVETSDTMRGSVCQSVWILSVSISLSLQDNATTRIHSPQRDSKAFSLFSIVQFPNKACTSTSSTYSNG